MAMFSHVTVGVSDLEQAASFYDALLSPLGLTRRRVVPDGGPPSRCWHRQGDALPRFYVYLPFDGQPCAPGNGSMVAFLAPSIAAVKRAHAEGLKAGGTDDGPPGPRSHYGAGYYGAYLRDPDGNKIHVVQRGDLVTRG